jgi:hypothetical protein
MSKTITVQYFPLVAEDSKLTTKYLNSLGMTSVNGFEETYFHIEVSEEPEILNDLREAGIFELRGGWSIHRITAQGIVLYISCPIGDGYAFIPPHQIITIHTVNKSFLDAIKQQARKT